MNGLDVLAFFVGAGAGYLLAIWASKRTLESLADQLEETQQALLEQRKRQFTPQWEARRLRRTQELGQ